MQDESVQFRAITDSSIAEQRLAFEAFRSSQNQVQPSKVIPEPPKEVNMVHSSIPVKNPDVERIIQAKMKQERTDIESRDKMQGATPKGSDDVPVPASLWIDIHGQTLLKEVMGLPSDNAQTDMINEYILSKMRVGKMEDTVANYERVLNNLLAKNNLSMNQQKSYLLKKLGIYLGEGNAEDEDALVLSILNIKKGKSHGIRR